MNGSGRVGYRFHPSDEEIIDYFLRHKINGTLISDDDIFLIDICKFEPWDLPKYAAQGPKEDEWYFFHKREMKNKNSSKPRYNRSTKTGHWKPTGKVRPIKAKRSRTEIGVKKTLVFYKYAESNKELRTNWVIHEYEPKAFPSHQADLVLCKLKEKADDKAETSTCREAEFTRRGPSEFDILPALLSSSESLFPNYGVNFDQPYTLPPQIQIDEGVSIDDLELSDDIFQSSSDGFLYQFGTNDQQPDPNEMDISFFDTFSEDPIGHSLHTGHAQSSSGQSHSGIIYLEEIADMDSDHFYGMPSQFGDQNLNSGYSSPREYRQMQSVQLLTETLPAPICEAQSMRLSSSRNEPSGVTKNLERYGKTIKGSPMLVEAHTRSGNKNMAVGKSQILVNFSRPSELKVREARKRLTGLNLPCDPPEEKITLKTEKEAKIITAKRILMPTSTSDKTCSSINMETSMLYQRSAPLSVYIFNVSIGLVLFVAAFRDLLIYH